MATRKDEMKSAEFPCGRLDMGLEKYIKQKKKEKNTENIKKEVAVGEGVVGYGPQTVFVLSGARESADDYLAMKNGLRISNCADGRLAMRKSPKRKKKNRIQKQKRKKYTSETGSKSQKDRLESKGFMAFRKRTSCWKQRRVTYFSPRCWVFLTGTSGFFGMQAVWICTFSCKSAYFPLSNSFGAVFTLIAFAVESWGLEAAQLQAWQAFYDGVNGMSSCSKCSNRNDPCSCGWGSSWNGPGVLCEGDSITKISLYSCSLSGKSRLLLSFALIFFLWFSHGPIFFLIV